MKRGFTQLTISDLFNIFTGRKNVNDTNVDGKYIFFSCSPETFKSNEYIYKGEAIIITGNGSYTGTVRYFNGAFDLYQRTYALTPKENSSVDTKYIFYLLKILFEPKFMGGTRGSSIPYIVLGDIADFGISLPTLPEQKRISSILSSFDNKIEQLKKENNILEDIAQNIFKEWFIKYNFPNKDGKPYKDNNGKMIDSELGLIPEGWRVGKLGELCNILGSGGTPTTTKVEYYGDKYDWFTTKELQDTFLLSSEKKMSEAGLNNSSAKLFPKNSVLIAIYAAPTVGRLGILSHEGTFNQATCGLYANENSSNEFLFLYLLNERRNLNNLASGAAQQNLNVGIIKNYLVLCPDKITNKKFADTVKPLFEEIEVNIKKQANLLKQKKSLLKFLIK